LFALTMSVQIPSLNAPLMNSVILNAMRMDVTIQRSTAHLIMSAL